MPAAARGFDAARSACSAGVDQARHTELDRWADHLQRHLQLDRLREFVMREEDEGMRITRSYTKTGDAGQTRLAGGQQVWKDSLRVEAYGTVDELNASVGVVRAFAAERIRRSRPLRALTGRTGWVQHKLFDVRTCLPPRRVSLFRTCPAVTPEDVRRLEQLMDACQERLFMKEFILPGGGKIPVACSIRPARSADVRSGTVCGGTGRAGRSCLGGLSQSAE
ncbi:MAG: ATP:cob(I)alamin adenosyltransferase [Nitrospiraceae bacterium]